MVKKNYKCSKLNALLEWNLFAGTNSFCAHGISCA